MLSNLEILIYIFSTQGKHEHTMKSEGPRESDLLAKYKQMQDFSISIEVSYIMSSYNTE